MVLQTVSLLVRGRNFTKGAWVLMRKKWASWNVARKVHPGYLTLKLLSPTIYHVMYIVRLNISRLLLYYRYLFNVPKKKGLKVVSSPDTCSTFYLYRYRNRCWENIFPLENKKELKQSPMDPLHSLAPYAPKDPFSYCLLVTIVNQFQIRNHIAF
jgi:hypothetical protein